MYVSIILVSFVAADEIMQTLRQPPFNLFSWISTRRTHWRLNSSCGCGLRVEQQQETSSGSLHLFEASMFPLGKRDCRLLNSTQSQSRSSK